MIAIAQDQEILFRNTADDFETELFVELREACRSLTARLTENAPSCIVLPLDY